MIIKLNQILFSLLPLFLVFSNFLSDFTISIMALTYLFYILKGNEIKIFSSKIFLIFFIWWIYIILLSLFSTDPLLSLESSLFYIRFILFVLAVRFFLIKEKNFVKYFLICLFLTFIILILDSFIQISFGKNTFLYPITTSDMFGSRISSFFKDEYILGSYLVRLLPLLGIFYLIYVNNKFKYEFILTIIFLSLLDMTILITGERAAILYLIIFSLSFFIFSKKIRNIIIFKNIISIILFVFLINEFDDVKTRVVDYTLYQLNELQLYDQWQDLYRNEINKNESTNIEQLKIEPTANSSIKNENNFDNNTLKNLLSENIFGNNLNLLFFSVQHQSVFITSLKIFKDYPYFGIGPKVFREFCKIEKYSTTSKIDKTINGCQSHPHNTYIQLLTETGIFGFLIVFLFFIFVSYKIYILALIKNNKNFNNDYNMFLLLAIFITLWPIIPNGNFFNNWLNIIYYLPLGFYLIKDLIYNETNN